MCAIKPVFDPDLELTLKMSENVKIYLLAVNWAKHALLESKLAFVVDIGSSQDSF